MPGLSLGLCLRAGNIDSMLVMVYRSLELMLPALLYYYYGKPWHRGAVQLLGSAYPFKLDTGTHSINLKSLNWTGLLSSCVGAIEKLTSFSLWNGLLWVRKVASSLVFGKINTVAQGEKLTILYTVYRCRTTVVATHCTLPIQSFARQTHTGT